MFSSETSGVTQSTSILPKTQPMVSKKTEYSEVSTDVLTTNGKRIFLNKKLVWKNEVRRLMTNTEGLHFYEKGLSQRRWGNILIWTGVCTALYAFSPEEPIIPVVGVGTGVIAGGIVLKVYSKKNIRKSVSLYNSRNQSSQVIYQFGTTPHGMGMVINF